MRVLLWGTADTAKKLLEEGLSEKCVGFIESEKKADSFLGQPIFQPKEILDVDYDCIVITSSRFCEEIYQRCLAEKIELNKVIFYNKFLREKWYENTEMKISVLGEALYKEYVENHIMPKTYGQFNQDSFAYNLISNMRMKKGVYVDIGAYDGICFSNTKMFEELGWKGVCIEPNPYSYELLVKNRTSINLNVAISEHEGWEDFIVVSGQASMLSGLEGTFDEEHRQRIDEETHGYSNNTEKIRIQTTTFGDVINRYLDGITTIDFVSIDVEGGEYGILQHIDFEKYKINLLVVERNYDETVVHKFMKEKGYVVIKDCIDDFFIREAWINECV